MRRVQSLLFLLLSLATSGAGQQLGTIDTVAGGGPNHMPATSANIRPTSIAVDSNGNLFIVSSDVNGQLRVFRVDPLGTLTVFAGTGTLGTTGDGGPAINATFSNPWGVAINAGGDVYVSDSQACTIRRIDRLTNTISLFAGSPFNCGFAGDGGAAANASLKGPRGIAISLSGDVYFADTQNHRVRRVQAGNGAITTVAGNGIPSFSGDGGLATQAGLAQPIDVAFDPAGNLLILENQNNGIRRVDLGSGIITSIIPGNPGGYVGDGGPASLARLNGPLGISVDSVGNIYIADNASQRIRKIDAATGTISSIFGPGLLTITDVFADSAGNLLFTGGSTRVFKMVLSTGAVSTVAGSGETLFSGDGGLATDASIGSPRSIAFDLSGNLIFADGTRRIRLVNAATGIISTIAGNGIIGPTGDGGPASNAALRDPRGLAADLQGNLYFVDGNQIRRVDAATGIITTVAGTGFAGYSGDGGPATQARFRNPFDVLVDVNGNLYIADTGNMVVRYVDAATQIVTTVAGTGLAGFSGDGGPATSANLWRPSGLALDAQDNLYISDTFNGRIRRVDAITKFITTVVETSLGNLLGIDFDLSGNLYIADSAINVIRKVDSTGAPTTVAGTGVFGFSGDGGLASNASLATPQNVTIGPTGDLYIVDSQNDRVRRVVLVQQFNTPAGTDVVVQPVDPVTNTTPVTLTFDNVTQAGDTSVTFLGTGGCPSAPGGFRIGQGGQALCYEITTTAQFAGFIEVCFTWPEGAFPPNREANLRLLHFENGSWSNVTSLGYPQPANNLICGRVTSLSPLAVFQANEPPVADAGPDQTIPCVQVGGTQVSLNGSNSFDADGDALTYTWTGTFPEGGGAVIGVNPTVTLSIGTHTIQLVVSDGVEDSTDIMVVRVGVGVAGFASPLAALVPDGDSVPLPEHAFRQGSTLPLRMQMTCGGVPLGDTEVAPPRIVSLVRNGDAIDLTTVDLDAGQSNDSGVLFRSAGDAWVYNLSTKGLGSGSYIFTIETPGGLRYAAAFVLR